MRDTFRPLLQFILLSFALTLLGGACSKSSESSGTAPVVPDEDKNPQLNPIEEPDPDLFDTQLSHFDPSDFASATWYRVHHLELIDPNANLITTTLKEQVDQRVAAQLQSDLHVVLALQEGDDAVAERFAVAQTTCSRDDSTQAWSCELMLSDDEPDKVKGLAAAMEKRDEGSCYTPPDGTIQQPGLNQPEAPCFVSQVVNPNDNNAVLPSFNLALGDGLSIELYAPVMAAQYTEGDDDASPKSLGEGVLAGFLTDQDAQKVMVPTSLGNVPLSQLLPDNAQDSLYGVTGWMLFFNMEAEEVTMELP